MSQEVISQKVRRTCDGCGEVFEYEMVDAPDSVMEELTGWFTVVRELIDTRTGRFYKAMAMAHNVGCVSTAALKLVTIPQSDEPDIDLGSLQVGTPTN